MQTRQKIYLYRDIACISGTILTFIMVYFYICEFLMSDHSIDAIPILIIFAIVIEDFLLRKFVKTLIPYIVLHLLPVLLLIPPCLPLYGSIILGCIEVFVLYNSIVYWKKDGLDKHYHAIGFPAETAIVYILIFFHCFYGLSEHLTIYVYAAGSVFFINSFLIRYFDSIIMEYVTAEGNNRNLPGGIYSLNSTLVAMFTGFIVLLVIGISLSFSDASFNFIGRLLKYAASFIMSIFTLIPKWKGKTSDDSSVSDTPAVSATGPGYIESSDNPVANAIFIAVQIIIYGAIFIGVIYLIYNFFRQYMYRSIKSDDIVESQISDEIADIKNKPGDSPFKKIAAALSPNERIRKLYYKKVTSLTKMNLKIKKSNTVNEISAAAIAQTDTSIDELSEIYQKARYGSTELTKDDVNRCKNLL